MAFDAASPVDKRVVLDVAVVAGAVHVVDVVNLLDDGVVEVNEVRILVDVIVVVVMINATGDDVVCNGLDVVVVADADKLLLVNDDVDEVDVDSSWGCVEQAGVCRCYRHVVDCSNCSQ